MSLLSWYWKAVIPSLLRKAPIRGSFSLQKLNHRLNRGFGIQKTTELTVVYFLAAIFVASVLALFAMLVIIVAIK